MVVSRSMPYHQSIIGWKVVTSRIQADGLWLGSILCRRRRHAHGGVRAGHCCSWSVLSRCGRVQCGMLTPWFVSRTVGRTDVLSHVALECYRFSVRCTVDVPCTMQDRTVPDTVRQVYCTHSHVLYAHAWTHCRNSALVRKQEVGLGYFVFGRNWIHYSTYSTELYCKLLLSTVLHSTALYTRELLALGEQCCSTNAFDSCRCVLKTHQKTNPFTVFSTNQNSRL